MPRLRIQWRHRLAVKLTMAIALVTAGAVATFVVLALRAQTRQLTEEVVSGAATFSDTIRSSTYHEMLAGRKTGAYQIMQTIGRQEGVDQVRLFNRQGRITFSSDADQLGRRFDRNAVPCSVCHASGRPLAHLSMPSRARTYRSSSGHRTLGMVTPIYNEAACYTAACHAHPREHTILGVVDIGLSLERIDRGLAGLERRMILSAVTGVLLLSALAYVFVRTFVARPVARLVRGTERIASGDLDHEVALHRHDEIGTLAQSFDQMTRTLREAQDHVIRLMENLEHQVEERTAALKNAQSQLIQAEKMASLGKLAASITHEINNPLAGILVYAKLLIRTLEKGTPDEATRAKLLTNLQLVARETRRCSTIVRNLLDFARQRELAVREMDVNAAIEEALGLMDNQMSIQGIELTRDLGTLPRIEADFGQLRQTFLNIVLNACEAMATQGQLKVTSRADPDGGSVRISITDSGPGIPPEVLKRVLEPFFTTKEKGTGLGLSVVYGIVERHGGTLDIRSEVGKGTTIVVTLPVKRPGTQVAAPAAAAVVAPGSATGGGHEG